MKELIQELSSLTIEQINNLTVEESIGCLEDFTKLQKGLTEIWNQFKKIDATNHSDKRTLDIINNHASGAIIEKMKEYITLTAPRFLVKETAIPDLYEYKAQAEIFLDYKKHEKSLNSNHSLITNHLEALLSEQNSTFDNDLSSFNYC